MDIIKISDQIEKKIQELEVAKKHLQKRSEKKAVTNSDYDKALALVMLRLRNKIITEFEGEQIGDLPATVLEKIAKGICYKERLEQEKSDAEYKSLITYISTVESQLNGWQSIYRHLEER